LGSLNVRIEHSPDGHEVALRLCGRMDEAAAARFGRVRDAVLARGCRKLTLDVSGLTAITTQGLNALLDTARRIKEAGTHLTLADRQGRFNHIVRVLHLNRVLTQGRDKSGPRRRVANHRFDPPGSA